uniref:Uncharacterized protein n=1 Tax=Culex tarsalis TaxID=7177 RepID=A0A1Q3F9I1_CULTA
MAVFRLHRFPHVCRLCFEPDSTGKMVPLTTDDDRLEGTIEDFITACTFLTAADKTHLFPRQICKPCLEMVRFYAAFRAKMMNVQLLMNALVELKFFNTKPMTDLFQAQGDSLRLLFKDLNLCSGGDASAEALIKEFPQYEIARISGDKDVAEPELDILVEDSQEPEVDKVLSKSLPEPPSQAKPPPEYDLLNDSDELPEVSVPLDIKGLEQALAGQTNRGKRCDKLINCPKCSFTSHYLRSIQAHLLKHLRREAETYLCKEPNCPAGPFKTYQELARHRANHRLIICEQCGARFKTEHYLKVHSRLHTKRKRSHERTHGDERLLPCGQCDGKFNSKQALANHRRDCHTGGIESCKYCSETFHNRGVMLDHVVKSHGINLQFECYICIEPFETQAQLNVHRERHRNPQHLECGTCLVQFVSQDDLQRHVCFTYIPHLSGGKRDRRNRARRVKPGSQPLPEFESTTDEV